MTSIFWGILIVFCAFLIAIIIDAAFFNARISYDICKWQNTTGFIDDSCQKLSVENNWTSFGHD